MQSSTITQVERCEARQLLSATGAQDILCDPVIVRPDDSAASTRVSWDAVEGATEYEVFVGQPGQAESLFRVRGIKNTSFEIPDQIPFGNHTIWVRAHSANESSPWGSGTTVNIDNRAEVTTLGRTVSWSAVDTATEYDIWVSQLDDNGNVLHRIADHGSSTDTEIRIDESLSGRFKAWVRPVRVDGTARHVGYWSTGTEFSISQGPDINDFRIAFSVNEYLIEQAPVRAEQQLTPELEITEFELFYAGAAILDAEEYLLRIHAASGNLTYESTGAVTYADAENLVQSILLFDQDPPVYGFEFELIGNNGSSVTRQTFRPIADFTRADLVSLGTDSFSIRLRIRYHADTDIHWSEWTPPSEFVLQGNTPAAVVDNPAENTVLRFSQQGPRGRFSEADLVWDGGRGTPEVTVSYGDYELEVSQDGTFLQTFFPRASNFSPGAFLLPGDYSARVRTRNEGELSGWTETIQFTIQPQAVTLFSDSQFSAFDRTPKIVWNPTSGTKSYRIVVTDTVTLQEAYSASVTGTPLAVSNRTQSDNFATSDFFVTRTHELTSPLTDGVYSVRIEAIYENDIASPVGESREFEIGGRPEIFDLTGSAASAAGRIRWTGDIAATEYVLWFDALDEDGNTATRQALLETTTDPDFEIPTSLAAGKYRIWVQTVVREDNGTVERSKWSVAADIRLGVLPETINVEGWTAVEYQVEQAELPATDVAGDLPEFTLRIGADLPIRYSFSNSLSDPQIPMNTPSVFQFELHNIETDRTMYRTVTGILLAGDNLALDLTAEDAAQLQNGEVDVRVRQRYMHQPTLTANVLTSRFNDWSVPFRFVAGTTAPTPIPSRLRAPWEHPVLTWTAARPIRKFNEAEIVYHEIVTDFVDGRPVIEEHLPKYEVWINYRGTGERVLYERDLTEPQFTVPNSLGRGNFSLWIRSIVDGQYSLWSLRSDYVTIDQTITLVESAE